MQRLRWGQETKECEYGRRLVLERNGIVQQDAWRVWGGQRDGRIVVGKSLH